MLLVAEGRPFCTALRWFSFVVQLEVSSVVYVCVYIYIDMYIYICLWLFVYICRFWGWNSFGHKKTWLKMSQTIRLGGAPSDKTNKTALMRDAESASEDLQLAVLLARHTKSHRVLAEDLKAWVNNHSIDCRIPGCDCTAWLHAEVGF